MKIFIAGKFESREELKVQRRALEEQGHKVTSRWLDEGRVVIPLDTFLNERSSIDLEDIKEAELFVIDTSIESNTGGREVELGYALALDKSVFIIGPRRNVHHWQVGTVFSSWHNFLIFTRGLA